MKKVFFLCFLQFQFLSNLSAQQPYLVKDVDSTVQNSAPTQLVQAGSYVYFTASTNKYGREVWKTDGTTAGTALLKDLYLGPGSSNARELYNHNGTLYFFSTVHYPGTADTDYGLWKSDGTEQGTIMLRTFYSEADGWFESIGNDLYFSVSSYEGGRSKQLWKTDGTTAGTVMLTSTLINAFAQGPFNLTKVDDKLLFAVENEDEDRTTELWRSDGTVNGTYKIKKIRIRKKGIDEDNTMLSFKNKVYFVGENGALWTSNGTEAGTLPVYEFADPKDEVRSFLYKTSDYLYFKANYGGNYAVKNFVSDGTTAGTRLSHELNDVNAGDFKVFNDELYFLDNGRKKISKLVDNVPVELTPSYCYGCYINDFFPSNIGVYFLNSSGSTTDIWFAPKGSNTPNLLKSGFYRYDYRYFSTLLNDKLIIGMYTLDTDREPWISDGTVAGTFLLKNIHDGTPSSDPYNIINHNNNVSFFAKSGSKYELWTHSPADSKSHKIIDFPTQLVKPYGLTSINNFLFFGKQTEYYATTHQVWRSDNGNAYGVLAFQSVPDVIENLTGFDNHIFFRSANRLWRADSVGRLRDIFLPGNVNAPMAISNGSMYFSYDDNSGIGYELFKLNANSSTPVLIKDIFEGEYNSSPQNFITTRDNSIYFSALRYQPYLFYLDGQSNIKQITDSLGYNQIIHRSILLQNKLIFTNTFRDDYNGGYLSTLLVSDTTRAGTFTLKDFKIYDSDLAGVKNLTFYRNKIYFTVADVTSGLEVWVTDGTKNGTKILKDIYPGSTSSMASDLYVANGLLYFSATHPLYGRELWRTDGTEAGTKIVYDLNTGVYSSNPGELLKVEDKLFFRANDGRFGNEIWAINLLPCADNLVLNANISGKNTDYEAEQEISATSQINGASKVKFDAGNSIVLKPGFRVDSGSVFRAIIDGCGNN